MKLYQFAYSPFAAKVRKCLELKRLSFEIVEVPLMDRRALVAITGGSIMVPVLQDGAVVVEDSPRITAHLEQYGPSLRPSPLAVIVEGWADNVLEDVAFRVASPFIETRIAALNDGRDDARALFRLVKERKFGAGCLDAWGAQHETLTARLLGLLAPVNEAVARRPFIFGGEPSVADAAVYGQLFMIEWAIPDFAQRLTPAVREWYARVHAAPQP